MKTRRIVVPALAATLACAVPAAADAATLAPNKPCYGAFDTLTLLGAGYTPGGSVNVTAAGAPIGALSVGPTGSILGSRVLVPVKKSRTDAYLATDVTNPAITAGTSVRRSITKVTVAPRRSRYYARVRVKARGFTAGKTLYRHTKLGSRISNRRQGSLKGACRTGSYKLRLFKKRARYGTYTVQFDTSKKYSSKTLQAVAFKVRVYRILVRRSSASAASASAMVPRTRTEWTRIR